MNPSLGRVKTLYLLQVSLLSLVGGTVEEATGVIHRVGVFQGDTLSHPSSRNPLLPLAYWTATVLSVAIVQPTIGAHVGE
jgi:hypothetical protein